MRILFVVVNSFNYPLYVKKYFEKNPEEITGQLTVHELGTYTNIYTSHELVSEHYKCIPEHLEDSGLIPMASNFQTGVTK